LKNDSTLSFLSWGKESSKKEKIIIVFGLKESTKGTISEKKSDDIEKINRMLRVLSLQNENIEGNFRLSAKDIRKPKPFAS